MSSDNRNWILTLIFKNVLITDVRISKRLTFFDIFLFCHIIWKKFLVIVCMFFISRIRGRFFLKNVLVMLLNILISLQIFVENIFRLLSKIVFLPPIIFDKLLRFLFRIILRPWKDVLRKQPGVIKVQIILLILHSIKNMLLLSE